MHINSHFTPANFGASSRPDHAANPSGRAQQFEEAPEDVEAAASTDTSTAVAATEATEETKTHGRSVAHQAREQLNTLQGLGGHNFGWLVSQIAQGTFDASGYAPIDESSEDASSETAAASTEETGEGETEAAASEEDTAASTDETADAVADPVADPVVDPVAGLVDDLLEDGEEDSEGGSEVT